MSKSTSKLFQSEVPTEMKEDAMNLPEEVKEEVKEETIPESQAEVVATPPVNDDIQDIDLSPIKKKRFRINGDSSKILELNTSDLSIVTRMSSAYDRLVKHMEEVGKILSALPEDNEEMTDGKDKEILAQLDKIDAEMKKELDYIFDAPVSEVCGDGGSMYDPFNGMFRYEHIIDALTQLYENNLNSEFTAMRRRVNTKTSKYTKKYHN